MKLSIIPAESPTPFGLSQSENMGDSSYAWQSKTFGLWSKTGFKGVLYAVPSSGKTHCGRMCIEEYLEYFPLNRIWIIANTKEVINQWKEECSMLPDIEYFTYLGAVSKFEKLKRENRTQFFPQLLILDECHLVNAPASGRVLEYGVEHVLGMSGTPNGSDKKIGEIFQKVYYDEANIADTTIHMVKFSPSKSELAKYDRLTDSINAHKEKWPYSNYYNDPVLQRQYLYRRQVVYKFESRLTYAVKLVEANKGRKIMCFCMLQEQAKKLSAMLDAKGIPNTLHLANREGLSKFINGEVNVCISCKKLSTGFNYPEADVGILVSTATAPLTLIQTSARVIRPKDGKHADVYILQATGTSDESIDEKQLFLKENIVHEDINNL